MGYYAMLVPAYTGHLNPMAVLGRALQRRGHRVAIVSVLEAEAKARKAGLEFIPIATVEFPHGEWNRMTAQMGELSGWAASRFAGHWLKRFVRGILRDLPVIVERERFDGLVMDQISIGAESVCEAMGLPFAVACNSLIGHAESRVPPVVFSWRCRTSVLFRPRNLIGQFILLSTGWPLVLELVPFRLKHKLPRLTYSHGNEMPPSLVQVAQTPAFFDFPRRHLPDHFHYTGPWSEPEGGNDADFPWDRVDGRPLIYASFGTLQNRLQHPFRLVAEACAGLEAQLVLTLGHEGASLPENLPGNPIVVDYAPQVALLRRARLVITHGGLNTTLECLSEGLPLIALPIANDQPGVAARIARLGVGEFIPIKKLTASKLRDAVSRVLASPTYRIQAEKCALEIQRIDGPARAAQLVEVAFTTRQRVKRTLPE
jgi:UDP:flavonoid glycosyltransferase YjiC (YdhE family)